MNKKLNLDRGTIKLIYVQYKKYLLPIGIILLCVILFIYVIIPKIGDIQDLQDEQKQEETRLKTLKDNLNLLYSLDSKTLDDQLRLASKALPTGKDFIGILSGITIASSKAGITLGDYGFKVGDILKPVTGAKGIPTLELSLNINGDLTSLVDFIAELKNTLPLSEVKIISMTNRNSSITTVFYYKPLPSVKIKDDIPLKPLSTSALELINKLSLMNNAELIDLESIQVGTESASPSGGFF